MKGHDTGYVYSSEKLSLNERHWRFTLYGLSSIEVPKAALEFFLNPAIPAGMKPPPPPPKEEKKKGQEKSIVTITDLKNLVKVFNFETFRNGI